MRLIRTLCWPVPGLHQSKNERTTLCEESQRLKEYFCQVGAEFDPYGYIYLCAIISGLG